MANTNLPAGERINKTPNFYFRDQRHQGISGLDATNLPQPTICPAAGRNVGCRSGHSRRFRVAVSGLRSLDGENGVNFHTYSLPEDRCVRLLIKTSAEGCLRTSCCRSDEPRVQRTRSGSGQGPSSHPHFIVSDAGHGSVQGASSHRALRPKSVS